MSLQWYVVHTQTSRENRVKEGIERQVRFNHLENMITEVLIPTENAAQIKDGKRRITTKKFFPGYVFVRMDLDDNTWNMIRNTPGVTGFIGPGGHPIPVPDNEVNQVKKQMEEGAAKPKPMIAIHEGETVKVTDGPFTNFTGTVDEIHPDKNKLKVMVSIFGRMTAIELDVLQVEKV